MEGPSLMGQSTNLKIRKNRDSFMARKLLSPKKCNLGRNLRMWVGHLQLQDQIKPNFYIKPVFLDNLLFFFPLLIHSCYSSTQHSSHFFFFQFHREQLILQLNLFIIQYCFDKLTQLSSMKIIFACFCSLQKIMATIHLSCVYIFMLLQQGFRLHTIHL